MEVWKYFIAAYRGVSRTAFLWKQAIGILGIRFNVRGRQCRTRPNRQPFYTVRSFRQLCAARGLTSETLSRVCIVDYCSDELILLPPAYRQTSTVRL
jgi:hypothetical protein